MPFKTFLSRWSSLRIGTRLTIAFAVVLTLSGIQGVFASLALREVNQASDELALKWLPGVADMASTRAAMLEAREFEKKLSRASDAGYLSDYEEKMRAAQATVAKSLAHFDELALSDDEAKLGQALEKSWGEYLAAATKVDSLAKANKMDDAHDISDGAANMSADDTVSALDRLTAQLFARGQAASQRSGHVYTLAKTGLAVLAASSLLLGLGLAWAITRGLLRQLGGEPAAAAQVARAVAQGDLQTRITLRPGDTGSLMACLQHMQDSLARVVRSVRTGSEHVANASAEIASGNSDLSNRTELQASALQQTTASMGELGSAVSQNAESARQADQLARQASDIAQRGGSAVSQVVETMKAINDSSKKIAEITGVIDGIAFQTNILALNAAVEAARAGEQGRGFAVVAAEVRSLAQRSADAARQIKSLIAASVERVDQGSTQVDRAGETMTEVVAAIGRVTHIVNEISAASAEQTNGVRQVGDAVQQMDQGTQQNAALVEQSAAAAESLKQQAQQLVQAVAVFRV
jgi:methyl-accepting chemotaxis protein